MKRTLTLLALSTFLQAYTIESGAIDGRTRSHLEKDHVTVGGLIQLVHAKGYRCNYIDKLYPFAFGTGYHLSCDQYQYEYEIEYLGETYDRNSPLWKVTVD